MQYICSFIHSFIHLLNKPQHFLCDSSLKSWRGTGYCTAALLALDIVPSWNPCLNWWHTIFRCLIQPTGPRGISPFSLGTPVILPLPLGGIAALATGQLPKVEGLRATAQNNVCVLLQCFPNDVVPFIISFRWPRPKRWGKKPLCKKFIITFLISLFANSNVCQFWVSRLRDYSHYGCWFPTSLHTLLIECHCGFYFVGYWIFMHFCKLFWVSFWDTSKFLGKFCPDRSRLPYTIFRCIWSSAQPRANYSPLLGQ